jgi:hypothetical protein
MPLIRVNSTNFPEPSTYEVGIMDIVFDSKRDANGLLIVEYKNIKKYKIELGWKYLTTQQYSIVLNSFSSFFFDVTFHDPASGSTITRNFYVGDRNAGLFKYNIGLNQIVGWTDIKFNFIER